MKISLSQKNNITTYAIIFTILIIPFYQIRIYLSSISISILTCALILSNVILFFNNKKNIIKKTTLKNPFIFISLTFIFAFVPSLILFPDTHAYGVFIEWILFPTLFGILLYINIKNDLIFQNVLSIPLIIIFFYVSIISLLFFLSNNKTYDGRLSAFFLSPNHLAMFLAPLVFVTAGYFSITKKYIHLIPILLGLLTIFLTQSFSTILALSIPTTLLLLFFLEKKRILITFMIILITTLFIVGYQKIQNSDIIIERNSFFSRIMIWNTSIYYIQKNPIQGYQLDNFQKKYLDAQTLFPLYLEWDVPTPHNIIFTFLFSGGFFVFFVFCFINSYTLFCGYRNFKKTKRRYFFLYSSALLTILFCGIFDTPYWKNDLSVLFWIICVLIVAPAPSRVQVKEQKA